MPNEESTEISEAAIEQGSDIADSIQELLGYVTKPDPVDDSDAALQSEIDSGETTSEENSEDGTVQSQEDEVETTSEEEPDTEPSDEEEVEAGEEEGGETKDESTDDTEAESSSDSKEPVEELSEIEQRLADSEEREKVLLQALATGGLGLKPVVAPTEQAASPPTVLAPTQPAAVAPLTSFKLSDEEFEQMMSKKEVFLEVLSNAVQIGRQQTLNELPAISARTFESQMKIERFFDKNTALAPLRGPLLDRAIEIQTAIPGTKIGEALIQAGKDIREALKLVAGDEVEEGSKPGQVKVRRTKKRAVAPAKKLAKPTSNRAPKPKVEGGKVDALTRDIQELANLGL